MIRQCTTCGDPTDATLCRFCSRFGVSRSAAPNAVIRRRVMRELDIEYDRAQLWAKIAESARDEARWWKRCATALLVLAIAALLFGLSMLNALPSASAAGLKGGHHAPGPGKPGSVAAVGEAVSRSSAAARAASSLDRELLRRCPSFRVMPKRHCVAWMRVAQCETGDPADVGVSVRSMRRIRWRYNGSSGFDGAHQWRVSTWRSNVGRIPARRLTRAQWVRRERGAYRYAWQAPSAVQVLAADALRVRRGGGLGHWPTCGRRWRP